MIRYRTLAVAAVVGLVLVALTSQPYWSKVRFAHDRGGRVVHGEGDGFLSAQSGPGGVSIHGPAGRHQWWATYGGLLLCVPAHGTRVHLDGVRTVGAPRPQILTHRLRVVPGAAERIGRTGSWDPIGSARGRLPHLDVGLTRGEVLPLGGVIDQYCEGPDGVHHRFTELLTEMRVGPEGAVIKRTLIDYSVDGKRYTLAVPWEMTACASRTPEHCSPPPG